MFMLVVTVTSFFMVRLAVIHVWLAHTCWVQLCCKHTMTYVGMWATASPQGFKLRRRVTSWSFPSCFCHLHLQCFRHVGFFESVVVHKSPICPGNKPVSYFLHSDLTVCLFFVGAHTWWLCVWRLTKRFTLPQKWWQWSLTRGPKELS